MKSILQMRAISGFVILGLLEACAAPAQMRSTLEESAPLAAFEERLRATVLEPGETPRWSIRERMAHYNAPGVAVAILRDGKVVFAEGYGVREAGAGNAVDADTLFSVGSISKIATAAVSLRLVDDGVLDLDQDIDSYLNSWRLPPSPESGDPHINLRMLMSHTAGLNVHGFEDFQPDEPLPTLLQILNGAPPAKNDPVRLIHAPGSQVDYSGGGVMVEQLVIEEVTGKPLEKVARAQLFGPLGMQRSTFAEPSSVGRDNIAKAHDDTGGPTALPRGWESFPESAASGLWTSANDLGALVGALIASYQGRSDFLSKSVATQMMTQVAPSWHGLGPRLDGWGDSRTFHHGGSNAHYQAWIEGHLESGDGLVILTNGRNGGDLKREIRNAVSDMLGWQINVPIRTIKLDLSAPRYQDFAGSYDVDKGVPMDIRQRLADILPLDTLQIKVSNGVVTGSSDHVEPFALQPLTPNRFVSPSGTLQIEFHRDARGAVRALTINAREAKAYYRRREARVSH